MNRTIFLEENKVPICPDCKHILMDEGGDNGEDYNCEVCSKEFYESQIEWCKFQDLKKQVGTKR